MYHTSTPMPKATLRTLFDTLTARWRPEDVAKAILDVRGEDFTAAQRKLIERAAKHGYNYSSMSREFAGVSDPGKQIKVAEALFGIKAPSDLSDARAVENYLDTLNAMIHKTGRDFKADRLNRADRQKLAREHHTVPAGHRAYNKRFRLLLRLEDKFAQWGKVVLMRDLARIAKSRLAYKVEWEDFSADVDTACFAAYMAAKLNMRSLFTFGKQERAYDEIADMLFKRLDPDKAKWWVLAIIHPAPEVTERLTEEEKGRLLGLWFSIMEKAAGVLAAQVQKDNIDLRSLIVRRGNDSSTWNEAAGAFNKARDGWISTLFVLDMLSVLDKFAPGKALRLMAADVAWGHRTYGSGLDPDTTVWGVLPKPWDVISGKANCTRDMIIDACTAAGVEGRGWVRPREKGEVAAYKPTPELVHGVVISSPTLAKTLRSLGVFSGPSKGSKEDASSYRAEIDRARQEFRDREGLPLGCRLPTH